MMRSKRDLFWFMFSDTWSKRFQNNIMVHPYREPEWTNASYEAMRTSLIEREEIPWLKYHKLATLNNERKNKLTVQSCLQRPQVSAVAPFFSHQSLALRVQPCFRAKTVLSVIIPIPLLYDFHSMLSAKVGSALNESIDTFRWMYRYFASLPWPFPSAIVNKLVNNMPLETKPCM